MPTFMITSEPHSVQLSAEGRTSLVNCNDGRVVERPLLFVSITSVCLHPEVEGQTGRCQDEHSPGQEWGRTHSACLWQSLEVLEWSVLATLGTMYRGLSVGTLRSVVLEGGL